MRTSLMITASFIGLAGGFTALGANAQTLADTNDAITVIATRTEKKVSEAPATVSVISDRDIEDQLADDIKDVVRFEPGVTVRSSPARFTAAGSSTGRDGNSGFNIRGVEGNRVLMQIDGIRVPEAFSFGAQSAGRGGYADLGVIKSIEILRGPASALYGSDGVAGAVSFTTKDPVDFLRGGKSFGGTARLGYSEADESFAKGLVLAGKSGDWSSMLAYNRRDGHEQATNGFNGTSSSARTTANPQDIESNALLAKIVYTPSDSQRVRLTYDTYDSTIDSHVLSAVSASTNDLQAHDETDRERVSLDYRWRGTGFIDAIDAVVYTQSAHNSQYAAEDRTTLADRTRLNLFDTTVTGGNIDFTSRVQAGSINHTFTYGVDVSTTKQTSLRDGTVPPAGETFPTRAFPTTEYVRTGVFIQDEIRLSNLTLYPALRYDSYELKPKADALLTTFVPRGQKGSHVSPKLGVVYKFTETTGLYVNATEGYKAPAPSEVNNAFSNLVANYKSLPNPDLKPETSQTLEAGLRYNTKAFSASVAVFSASYDDFIEQVLIGGTYTPTDPGLYQYVNLTDARISGAELRGRASLGGGFTLNLAASTTKGTYTVGGVRKALDSIEPLKVVAGVKYRSTGDRFGGAFTLTHSAQKDASQVRSDYCSPSCYRPPAFTVADVTGYWNITQALALRAAVFNIGDGKYSWWSDVRGLASTSAVTDAYTQPGRKVSLSLGYRF